MWIVHTRPDVCAAVNILAQTVENNFSVKDIQLYNRTVKQLQETPKLGLKMQKLDIDSLHLKVFSDSSFANNKDLSSQLGYIVLLCDKHSRCNILHFSSHKSRRVVRSVLGAEMYSFADAFDFAFTAKTDLENILKKDIPLRMLTDSKSLFDIITKNSHTSEKRLQIDIQVIREAYEKHEISDVGFIRSENNPADAFTKLQYNRALSKIMEKGLADFDVEKWVFRSIEKEKEWMLDINELLEIVINES